MDVGLDQAVTVAYSYGHHGVHCDPMGGKVARDGNVKSKKRKQKKSTKCYKVSGFKKYMIKLKICHLSGYFFAW